LHKYPKKYIIPNIIIKEITENTITEIFKICSGATKKIAAENNAEANQNKYANAGYIPS